MKRTPIRVIYSMLFDSAHYSLVSHPCNQNEIQFAFLYDIKVRIRCFISVDGFTKVCTVVHVILDLVFWVGVLVLMEQIVILWHHTITDWCEEMVEIRYIITTTNNDDKQQPVIMFQSAV
jgi:hypothetical protein